MISVINIVKQKGFTMAILAIVTLLCIYISVTKNAVISIALGLIPFALIFTYLCIHM